MSGALEHVHRWVVEDGELFMIIEGYYFSGLMDPTTIESWQWRNVRKYGPYPKSLQEECPDPSQLDKRFYEDEIMNIKEHKDGMIEPFIPSKGRPKFWRNA